MISLHFLSGADLSFAVSDSIGILCQYILNSKGSTNMSKDVDTISSKESKTNKELESVNDIIDIEKEFFKLLHV